MPTLADHPELLAQLDRRNGPIVPESIGCSSRRRLWWRCPAGPDHVWQVDVLARAVVGRGCPYCAGMRASVTNSLSKLAPAVARQWHKAKNGALRARDVTAGTQRVVWWKCPKGPDHEWRTSVVKRVLGTRCPFCCRRRVSASSNLAVVLPHLVPEWHPRKNGRLTPRDVLPGTSRSFWWRCARGHEWSATVDKRARGSGCPFCLGKRVAPETSLAARDPGLAKEWHPRKNGRLTHAG